MSNPYVASIENWWEVYNQRLINMIELDKENGISPRWQFNKKDSYSNGELVQYIWYAPNNKIFLEYLQSYAVIPSKKAIEVSCYIVKELNLTTELFIPLPLNFDYVSIDDIEGQDSLCKVTFGKKVVDEAGNVDDNITVRRVIDSSIELFEEVYHEVKARFVK